MLNKLGNGTVYFGVKNNRDVKCFIGLKQVQEKIKKRWKSKMSRVFFFY